LQVAVLRCARFAECLRRERELICQPHAHAHDEAN
jgi:hypothetical protein